MKYINLVKEFEAQTLAEMDSFVFILFPLSYINYGNAERQSKWKLLENNRVLSLLGDRLGKAGARMNGSS